MTNSDELIEKYVEDKDQSKVPSNVNKSLCDGCTVCCEHVAIELDEPEDKEDFDNVVWYVLHDNVSVFVDDEDDWYVQFNAKCSASNTNGLCKIHNNKPKVCTEYAQDTCEMHAEGSPYKQLFNTREEVVEYVQKHTKFKNFGK